MRNAIKVLMLMGTLIGAGTHAYAQASSAPSSDERQTADKAVGKMKGSQHGKPINNNQSWSNLKRDQPDETRAPAAPMHVVPTGQVSSKVPPQMRAPTKLHEVTPKTTPPG